MLQSRWLLAAAMPLTLVVVLGAVACDKPKPSVASRLAHVLWHQPPGRRAIGEGEYTYYPVVAGLDGEVAVSVLHDDEEARRLRVRWMGPGDRCAIDELAARLRPVRSARGGPGPSSHFRLEGGPFDGCVQMIDTPSSIHVATPAYAESEWAVASGTPAR